MNNELLLEWCILNNPGVKQDVFPNDANLDTNFTTDSDYYRYGTKDYVGKKSQKRTSLIDLMYDTKLGPEVKAQYDSDDGMKANDLGKGSDWINPKISNAFFDLFYNKHDEEHAKKLLKYAWLQGKIDNSGTTSKKGDKNKDVIKQDSSEDDNNSTDKKKTVNYNIAKYINDLDLSTLIQNTGNKEELKNIYTQEYLDNFKKTYLNDEGRQKFTKVQPEFKYKKLKDKKGNEKASPVNAMKMTVADLELLMSFPLWKKEFNNAYDRIKSYLNKFKENDTFKLYRGINLKPETKTLYNYKAISTPKTLYRILENDYNSATTDIARALYFAMNPTTKKLDQNSLIFEINVKKEIVNFPYTMYLNGKNGKYGECELNLSKSNLTNNENSPNQKITKVSAFIGPNSINNAIINNVENEMQPGTKHARSNSNQTGLYYINLNDRTIVQADNSHSKPNTIFKINGYKYCNINASDDDNTKKYYIFISAEANSEYTYFLFDRFTNTLGKCTSVKIKNTLIDDNNIKNIVVTYEDGAKSYKILFNNKILGDCAVFKDFSITRDYNSETYDANIKAALTEMFSGILKDKKYSGNNDILNAFKENVKKIYKFNDDELDEVIKKADDANFITDIIEDSKNSISKFINNVKTIVVKYEKYIDIKKVDEILSDINNDNVLDLIDILDSIKNEIETNIKNENNIIDEQNKLIQDSIEKFTTTIMPEIVEVLKKSIYKVISTQSLWLYSIKPIIDDNLPDATIGKWTIKQIFKLIISYFNMNKINDITSFELFYSSRIIQIIDSVRNKTITIDAYITKVNNALKTACNGILKEQSVNNEVIKDKINQFETDYTENVLNKLEKLINNITENNEYLEQQKNKKSELQAESYKFNSTNSNLFEAFRYFLRTI